MDIIRLSREIGRNIQNQEIYLKLQVYKQNLDQDKDLQELIGDFNLKKIVINNEVSKEDKNEDKIQKLNQELRKLYSDIMKNENMVSYNLAKKELDFFVKRITAIIMQSAEGQDPETTDYQEETCSGSCSSCSGCN